MDIVHSQRTDRSNLGDVVTRFGPMEMRLIAGKDDHCSRRVSSKSALIELLAQADIEDSRHHGVDAIFGVLMRHHSGTCRYPHADHIRPRLLRITNEDGQTRGRRIRSKRLPLKILGPDRTKYLLIELVHTRHDYCLEPGFQRAIGLPYQLIVVDPQANLLPVAESSMPESPQISSEMSFRVSRLMKTLLK